MSHFTVMVFGDNPEELLEPYDEEKRVEEYLENDLSQEEKDRFTEHYTKEDESLKDLSFKELYELKGEDWNDNSWKENEEGVFQEFSIYNPESKWDWYSVGGRWGGYFQLKEGENADEALKSAIDIESMRNKFEEVYRKRWNFINPFIEGLTMETTWKSLLERVKEESYNIDEARKDYHAQPLIVAFSKALEEDRKSKQNMFGWGENVEDYLQTLEEYIEKGRNSALTPFAYLTKDGWFEKGEMGWWGMASNEKSDNDWNEHFNKMFDELPEDTKITLVDCHI